MGTHTIPLIFHDFQSVVKIASNQNPKDTTSLERPVLHKTTNDRFMHVIQIRTCPRGEIEQILD